MEAKPKLVFQAADLLYEAPMRKPLLRLLTAGSGLLDVFLEAMEPFGGTLQTLRIDAPTQDLSRTRVSVSVFGGLGFVWIGASNLGCHLPRFPMPPPVEVLSDLLVKLHAVVTTASASEATAHSFTLSVHGAVAGTTINELISRYIGTPPAVFGSPIASAGSFTFGKKGSRRQLYLRFEPSEYLDDGLFAIAKIDLDSSVVSPAEAPQAAVEHVHSILRHDSFPLEVQCQQAD